MPFQIISPLALVAGRPLTSQLLYALWNNDRAIDHSRQAIDNRLLNTGHRHDVTYSVTFDFLFVDYVEVYSSGAKQNNFIDFGFSDGGAFTIYSASIGAGRLNLDSLATAVKNAMNTSAGVLDIINVEYINYFAKPGNPDIGTFVFTHNGSTDPRKFSLLAETGPNAHRSLYKRMGFPKIDQQGGLNYSGSSGFLHGFIENRIILGDGGQVGTAGLVDGSATSTKYAPGICISSKFGNNSVHGNNIDDGAITGERMGTPSFGNSTITVPVRSGGIDGANVVGINMSNARFPQARTYIVSSPGPIAKEDIYIGSIDHVSGNNFAVSVRNANVAFAPTVGVVAI